MRAIWIVAASALLAACNEATDVPDRVEAAAGGEVDTREELELATAAAAGAELREDQDVTTLPGGRYVDEDGHAYIAFSYSHQGFSNPILRFNGDAFEAVMDLVPGEPTQSTLMVDLDPSMIDSGVGVFDDHLRSADFFDVANHPEASFTSTSLSMDSPTTGTLLGDLTLKGVTKPVALDVTLNKVGEHFRSGTPMFGISAQGRIKRSDWDLGLYAPNVGDEVTLDIQVEFQKADEG